jgi:hypothetical protein
MEEKANQITPRARGGRRSAAARTDFLATNRFLDYNDQERIYGNYVRNLLLELLSGDRDSLPLLTKYHRDPNRLGAPRAPSKIDSKALRVAKVDEILSAALRFLHDGSEGGPIAQTEDVVRNVVEQLQDFTTRFPHIVVQRTDTFDPQKGEALQTTWCARRLQNHRTHLRINRALDIVNIGLEFVRLGR